MYLTRFSTLLIAALALSLTSAYVLEFPVKVRYGADLYAAVNTTLYQYFGTLGVVFSMGAVGLAGTTARLVRRRPGVAGLSALGFLMLVVWFANWVTIVAPVNGQIAAAIASNPDQVPELWVQLR